MNNIMKQDVLMQNMLMQICNIEVQIKIFQDKFVSLY